MGASESTTNSRLSLEDQATLTKKYSSLDSKSGAYSLIGISSNLIFPTPKQHFIKVAEAILHESVYEKVGAWKVIASGLNLQEFTKFLLDTSLKLIFNGNQNTQLLLDQMTEIIKDVSPDDQFVELMTKSKVFATSWQITFNFHLLDKKPPQLPSLTDSILSPSALFTIDLELQYDFPKRTYTRLYNSHTDGKSWIGLVQKLPFAESSLLIVKSKSGHVFGGFNPTPYIASPKFASNSKSFVFTSVPKLEVYRSSGINENFVYFNTGSKTFVNGIGFGGQLEYFGLYIGSDLERGHSRAEPTSTTFYSPVLSGEMEFEIDAVEYWSVVPRDLDSVEYKKSITTNPEAMALLEMAGKTLYSAQVSKPDPHLNK